MAQLEIQIGNNPLDSALLASVEVTQELNRHGWCTTVFRATEDQRPALEEMLGQPITIKTFDDQGIEHIHFSGFVYDIALTYEVWGAYTAALRAVTGSLVLDVTAHKQYYLNATLSSLVSQIAARNGVPIADALPSGKPLNYVQYGETDFSFLNRAVDDYGAWMRPLFNSPASLEILSSFQSGSTLSYRDTEGLVTFALRGRLAQTSFSGAHYDHHSMQSNTFQQVSKAPEYFDGIQWLTSAVASASEELPSGFEPHRARAVTLDDYQEQLEAESERALGSAVTGQGTSRNQSLLAGDTVQIQGLADASGTYGLIKVTHQWTPQGYLNHFLCTPWKNYRDPEPPPMRVWEGAVPARVADHDDPKKMGRLRVQFFWQHDSVAHWARMISPHAGPDRGFMFMPEIGDEVAVMFEDGDPERPVIVGSVWNGVQSAPRAGYFAPQADIPDNNVKRILTKSGNRLQMVDTPGVESVAVATPNNTSLQMTESSSATGNHMISLRSAGDIILSAKGRIAFVSKTFSRDVVDKNQPFTPPVEPNLNGMSCTDKMKAAMENAPWGAGILNALGGAKGVAIFVGAAIALQFVPIAGEVEDALLIAGTLMAGGNILKGLQQLKQFKDFCCNQAKTPEDLKTAGKMAADALATIGVNGILAALPFIKGPKPIEEPKPIETTRPSAEELKAQHPTEVNNLTTFKNTGHRRRRRLTHISRLLMDKRTCGNYETPLPV